MLHFQACCILQLVKYILKLHGKGVKVADEVVALFAGELNPVAVKAQKKVPVPEGYVLNVFCRSSFNQEKYFLSLLSWKMPR